MSLPSNFSVEFFIWRRGNFSKFADAGRQLFHFRAAGREEIQSVWERERSESLQIAGTSPKPGSDPMRMVLRTNEELGAVPQWGHVHTVHAPCVHACLACLSAFCLTVSR